MSKKKIIYVVAILLLAVISNLAIFLKPKDYTTETITFSVDVTGDTTSSVTLYYLVDGQDINETDFMEGQKSGTNYTTAGETQTLEFEIPANVTYIRIDPAVTAMDNIEFSEFTISYEGETLDTFDWTEAESVKEKDIKVNGDKLTTTSQDGNIAFAYTTPEGTVDQITELGSARTLKTRLAYMISIDAILLLLLFKGKAAVEIPLEVYRNKKLVFNLAKNDFKQKFSGSYLGIVWAFVQPIVTVVVYWFVFQKALNVGSQSTKAGIAVPYVLWLIAGLVPWFYFSEVLGTATNVLLEYSYLVKKVVFNISTLPVVKAISSLFVHCFFIGFMLVMYVIYGYTPNVHMLQIVYYSFCMMVLALGFGYINAAIQVFFRDLSQIVNIILQVGVWATPIMWNMDSMIISEKVLFILKLNPMYYVVVGYRDSMINNVYFWSHPAETIYFWAFTIIMFIIGTTVFKKLKIHFADVM